MKKYFKKSGNIHPILKKRAASVMAISLVIFMLLSLCTFSVSAEKEAVQVLAAPVPDCKSAILMEASTGSVLYEKNADEALPPASVTKIMTLLLVMEAIDAGKINYNDIVTASAHACSMGGSQIYLKEGEQMTVEDLVKSVVISSANDAAVALAEFVSGSEEAFVAQMNERARQLEMKNTTFENTNGLDDTARAHLTSARDIAIMSRELIKHKKITEYSSIWMDTIRDGSFGLTNTNRLVRFYKGATGLKTGSTSKAGFCISATAERDGMTLICVIMGSPTRDIRNSAATALLDWGFANYGVYRSPEINIDPVKVLGGKTSSCELEYDSFSAIIDKKDLKNVEYVIELSESVTSPIKKGDVLGTIKYRAGDKDVGTLNIYAKKNVDKIRYIDVFLRILCAISIN